MAFSQNQIDEIRRRLLACYGARDTSFRKVTSLKDDDIVAIVQDGENRAVRASDLAEYIGAKVGIPIGLEARIAGVKTVEAGGEATASVKVVNGNRLDFTFGIPRGDKGECTCDGDGDKDTNATGVTISGGSSVKVGETLQLTATVNPSGASGYTIKWSSSDTSVATVDQNGKVTGVGEGTATITCTVTNSDGTTVSDTYTVTVAAAGDTPATKFYILSSNSFNIKVGESTQLTAQVTPSDASGYTLEWYFYNNNTDYASIVSLGSDGKVTGLAEGGVVVCCKLTNADGTTLYDTCGINVTAASTDSGDGDGDGDASSPTDATVTADPVEATILLGEALTLRVKTASDGIPVPSGYDSGIINIYAFGDKLSDGYNYTALRGEGVGDTTITITVPATDNYNECSCTVTIHVVEDEDGEKTPATGMTISGSSKIKLGSSETLTTTVTPSDADGYFITWSSSDTSIASVTDNDSVNGKYTYVGGLAEGTATITAKLTNADGTTLSASFDVTVYEHTSSSGDDGDTSVTSVTISGDDIVTAGDTTQLTATVNPSGASGYAISWASSDSSVATIDENGLVTAVGTGTATITCTVTNSDGTIVTAEYTITVNASSSEVTVEGITVSPSTLTLAEGETYDLTATINRSDGSSSDVTAGAQWSSSDSGIASVSSGKVYAKEAGSCTITAVLDGKYEDSCLVTVTAGASSGGDEPTVTGISVSPSSDSVTVGDTTSLTATATYSDGSTKDVTSSATWSTSSSTYATVSKGTVTGVKAGSATITATYGGYSDSCSVTVNKAPTTVKYQFTNGSSYSCTVSVNGSSYSVDQNDYVSDTVERTLPASVDVCVSCVDDVDVLSSLSVSIDIGGLTESGTITASGHDVISSGTLTDDYPSISVDISSK